MLDLVNSVVNHESARAEAQGRDAYVHGGLHELGLIGAFESNCVGGDGLRLGDPEKRQRKFGRRVVFDFDGSNLGASIKKSPQLRGGATDKRIASPRRRDGRSAQVARALARQRQQGNQSQNLHCRTKKNMTRVRAWEGCVRCIIFGGRILQRKF